MTTQPAAPAPVRTAHRLRTAPPRVVAVLALVAAVSVAGCGSGTQPPGSTASTASTPVATPPPAGSTTAAPGALLWPVTDVTQAKALQAQVDQGSQAWLLDPSEVAGNYATTVLQWRAPSAGAPDGGTVVVTDPDAGSVTLALVQPATTGSAGIWVVSAERRN